MKIWTQLIAAWAILALAVPVVASAAATKEAPAHGAKSIAALHKSGRGTGVKLTRPKPKPVVPHVIFFQGPTAQPIVESQQQICQTQGAGCTAQQYCDNWKINCNSDPASGSSADLLSPDGQAGGRSMTVVDPARALAQLEADNCCDPTECMGLA